jgi:hypothetical protein
LTLPEGLEEFDCSNNRITSFDELKLPNSLTNFNCFHNQITSFESTEGAGGLTLPAGIIKFDCSCNKIKSLNGLKLPSSLIIFYCHNNLIKEIRDFEFPPELESLSVGEVKFINPKFHSLLDQKLRNKVEFDDRTISTHDELIFAYLNFNNRYDPNAIQFELIITKLETSED